MNNKVSFSANQLRTMTDEQISSLFHSSNWDRIDADTRLDLCQEVENRLAEQDGVEARTVVAEKMNGSVYGVQRDDIIAINADMLSDGVFCTTYTNENGNKITTVHSVDAPSWNTYDTIVHEHTHGASLDKGEMPYTYISPDTDYDLYRIQDEERIAFANGNNATKDAIAKAEAAMNKADYQKEDYIESIQQSSYEKSLENAQMKYNDPFIDKTLSTFIIDRDNGIIREDAWPSYKQIEAAYDAQLQRQLTEIMQSKEHTAEQSIEIAVAQAQEKTPEQIAKTVIQNDAVNITNTVNENEEDVSTTNETDKTNDGGNSLSSDAETTIDGGFSFENSTAGNDAAFDGGITSEVEGSYEQDDATITNDGGSAYDDGSVCSNDDSGMSYNE